MLFSQAVNKNNPVNSIRFLSQNNVSSKQEVSYLEREKKGFLEKLILTSSLALVAVLGFLYLVAKKGRAAIGFIMEPIIRNKLISYGLSPQIVEAVSRDNFPAAFSPIWIGQYLSVGFEVLFKRIESEGALDETRRRIETHVQEGELLSHFRTVTLPKLAKLWNVEPVLNTDEKQVAN